jgi:hypothetical protein
MTSTDNAADCLERARMHDQLAATTKDIQARVMHQAMAAEFRRRAAQMGSDPMTFPAANSPVLEMQSAPQ